MLSWSARGSDHTAEATVPGLVLSDARSELPAGAGDVRGRSPMAARIRSGCLTRPPVTADGCRWLRVKVSTEVSPAGDPDGQTSNARPMTNVAAC